jgi:hypothetical protein
MGATSDKMWQHMLATANDVVLPISPFLVLGVILIASLAVFLWITRSRGPDQ